MTLTDVWSPCMTTGVCPAAILHFCTPCFHNPVGCCFLHSAETVCYNHQFVNSFTRHLPYPFVPSSDITVATVSRDLGKARGSKSPTQPAFFKGILYRQSTVLACVLGAPVHPLCIFRTPVCRQKRHNRTYSSLYLS